MQAQPKPLAVHAWPQNLPLAVDELRSRQGLCVISVPTPLTAHRGLARELVRTALRETLAVFLNQPVASITLVSRPGQAIGLASPLAHLQISVSHMPGLSVAAMAQGVAVGVDVMDVQQSTEDALPDWAAVALDYLGPDVAAGLKNTLPAQRPAAFAHAWTHFEASLKCLGLALTEWTPALAQQLATCRVTALALPDPYRGAIAIASGPNVTAPQKCPPPPCRRQYTS
jgi:4'-phosphopantetheinyl transferase